MRVIRRGDKVQLSFTFDDGKGFDSTTVVAEANWHEPRKEWQINLVQANGRVDHLEGWNAEGKHRLLDALFNPHQKQREFFDREEDFVFPGAQPSRAIPEDSSLKNFSNVLLSSRFRRRQQDMSDEQMAEATADRIVESSGPTTASMASLKMTLKNDVKVFRLRKRVDALESALANYSKVQSIELREMRAQFQRYADDVKRQVRSLEENVKTCMTMFDNVQRAHNELNAQMNGESGVRSEIDAIWQNINKLEKKRATPKRKR